MLRRTSLTFREWEQHPERQVGYPPEKHKCPALTWGTADAVPLPHPSPAARSRNQVPTQF